MHKFASEKAVVLLIDSDPLMLTGMAALLDANGYICHVARDSEAAVRGAASICPDLVICDIELEGDCGLELCTEMLKLAGMQDVPVIYLANRRMPDIVARVEQAGGAYYLSKPLDPWVLLEVVDKALWMPHLVRTHLERHDAPATLGRPAGRSSTHSIPRPLRP